MTWVACIGLLTVVACGPETVGMTLRLSIATGGTGGVYYPYGGGIAKVISDHLDGVEATAEVTAGTVDNLKFIASHSADMAFALADSLDDAYAGRDTFGEFGAIPVRALAVLYDNFNHVVTVDGRGIESIQDLRGRVVSTGAPGSGTEISAFRILAAADVSPERAIRRQSLGATQSVAALKDGKIDAFFWSGGIPTGALLDLTSTPGVAAKLLGTDSLLPRLEERHGTDVYRASTIPSTTYPGIDQDITTIAVANVLVVHESMAAQLAQLITEAIFVNREEIAAIHPMAAALSLDSAVRGSPIPYHEGAAAYYREQGAWPKGR